MSTRHHSRAPLRAVGLVAASAAAIGLVGTSGAVRAADHLDAPGLSAPGGRADADINDVYAFNSDKSGYSVLVMTTHPGAGAIAPLTYPAGITYKINVDQNGDAVEDLAYGVTFGANRGTAAAPRQTFTVKQYSGAGARNLTGGRTVATGTTNRPEAAVRGGGKAWAGLRSDPFFFDLDAFRQVVLKQDRGRTGFCDKSGAGVDFFATLNTNAIILDLPNKTLGGKVGVWSQTMGADRKLIDQMGRPAINTVFNAGEDKNTFNGTAPSDQKARFAKNVTDTLAAFSALDKEGAYSTELLNTLAGVLVPDVITFDTATKAAGPLNGRALTDDVIDAELNIVTGGFEAPGRDAVGAITGDCVAAHTDISKSFPYLGRAHAAAAKSS